MLPSVFFLKCSAQPGLYQPAQCRQPLRTSAGFRAVSPVPKMLESSRNICFPAEWSGDLPKTHSCWVFVQWPHGLNHGIFTPKAYNRAWRLERGIQIMPSQTKNKKPATRVLSARAFQQWLGRGGNKPNMPLHTNVPWECETGSLGFLEQWKAGAVKGRGERLMGRALVLLLWTHSKNSLPYQMMFFREDAFFFPIRFQKHKRS